MKMILGGYNDFPHFTLRFVKKNLQNCEEILGNTGHISKKKKVFDIIFWRFLMR